MKIIQIGNHAAENLVDQVWNDPASEEPEPAVRNARPRDLCYNKGQRLLVWLFGVDYVSCTSCTACSKGHWLLDLLLWGYATTSIFWGVGPSFHTFNESRRPM